MAKEKSMSDELDDDLLTTVYEGASVKDNGSTVYGPETEESKPELGGRVTEAKAEAEKRPERKAPRTSLEGLITGVWGGAGAIMVQSQFDPPVGRVMQFQAPMVGNKLDKILAHTWIDKILQPMAGMTDDLTELASIVMFPIMVAAVERNPDMVGFARPFLEQMFHATVTEMAPIIRKKKADERRSLKAIADLNDLFDLPKGADPFETIMGYIFSGPAPQTEEANKEAENNGDNT